LLKLRRAKQDYRDYFLHHFPEESGETQSACGGNYKLRNRFGAYTVMPAPGGHPDLSQRKLGSKHNSNAGFPLSRLCRNWQIGRCCLFVIPDLTRNPVQFQDLTFLDAGSSPA
jgi:hypothetical protein